MKSYDSLVHSTLKNSFGFDTFREGQEAVIAKILEGKSALAVFPTGSGKSLCYQLSALLLDGLTLVISPLIALMKDQIDFLHGRNIPAARLDSTVELEEVRQIDADLRADRLKLLYVAPERFSNERFIQKLRQIKIALMVIDEAHCISEWGHNFRPDYLKLARTARSLGIQRVLTLTATATPAVAADICREFGIAADAFIHTGFYRPNLDFAGHTLPVKRTNRFFTAPSERSSARSYDCLCDFAAHRRNCCGCALQEGFSCARLSCGPPKRGTRHGSGLVHGISGCDCRRDDRFRDGD